jgi:hypothetical protein
MPFVVDVRMGVPRHRPVDSSTVVSTTRQQEAVLSANCSVQGQADSSTSPLLPQPDLVLSTDGRLMAVSIMVAASASDFQLQLEQNKRKFNHSLAYFWLFC